MVVSRGGEALRWCRQTMQAAPAHHSSCNMYDMYGQQAGWLAGGPAGRQAGARAHMHSLSLEVTASRARRASRWEGVTGAPPLLRPLLLPLLSAAPLPPSLPAAEEAAAAVPGASLRRETCFTPARQSSLHCSEQNWLTSCRWRLHTEHRLAPTAPLGGRGCGRRRRKMTLLLLMV